jgi:hypothetical protein
MKLTRQQEWIIIVALVAYLAFVPEVEIVKTALASPVGKALFLGLVVYKFVFVSKPIGVLLGLVYARHARDNVWEHLDVAPQNCKCKTPDFTYDKGKNACVNKDGKEDTSSNSVLCSCPSGYAWDVVNKTCNPVQSNQSAPIAPVPVATSSDVAPVGIDPRQAAPATGTGTGANTNLPMTTGSAAAQTMSTSGVLATPASGGAQPATGTSSTSAPV